MRSARRGGPICASLLAAAAAFGGCGYEAQLIPPHGRDYRVVTVPSATLTVPVPSAWKHRFFSDPDSGFVGIVASPQPRRWRDGAPGVPGFSIVASEKQAYALRMVGVRRAVGYDRFMRWCCEDEPEGCLSQRRGTFSRIRGRFFGVEDRGIGCGSFSDRRVLVYATDDSNGIVIRSEVRVPNADRDVAEFMLQTFQVNGPTTPPVQATTREAAP